MADLTITALTSLGVESGRRQVVSTLIDPATGLEVTGTIVGDDGDPVIVRRATAALEADGTRTLELEPNENITPANTAWRIVIGDKPFRIVKADAAETLWEALLATPDDLPGVAQVNLADVEDGQTVVFDADAGPAGQLVAADVDALPAVAGKVAKSGDTMEGDLDLDGNRIENLPAPAAAAEPARKAETDALDLGKDDRVHGREHTSTARQLTAGITSARGLLRPLRGVVVGDSIFELGGGLGAWQRLHQLLSPSPVNAWRPPRHGILPWDIDEGAAGAWGIDQRGTTLDVGEDAGDTITMTAAQELVVSYTAHTAGATIECRVDTVLVGSKDTSDDEDGSPVAGDTPAQQWVVGDIGPGDGTVDVLFTATGTGAARIEAYKLRAASGIDGVEIDGTGFSGQSSAECLAAGKAVAHVEAMTARGEPPDFILLGSDTADQPASPAALVADVVDLANALKAEAPKATIVYYIPHRHTDATTYATWDTAYAPALRQMCVDEGFLPIDGAAAIGDITATGGNPQGFGADGTHLDFPGLGALDDTILDVVASRTVTGPAGVAADLAAHLADTDTAHAASAVSVNPSGLVVVSTDDVQAALAEIDDELELKAPKVLPVFDTTGGAAAARFQSAGADVRVAGSSALGAMIGFYGSTAHVLGQGAMEIYGQLGVIASGPGGAAADLTWGRSAAGIFRIANGATTGGAVLHMLNMTAPAAPAGGAYLYIDTSGGKRRLMVRFQTGAAQQVAIEP